MNEHFEKLEKIINKNKKTTIISARIKFMIQDVLELNNVSEIHYISKIYFNIK